MNHNPRLWQHDTLWRIQDRCSLTLSNGIVQDAWESRKDGNGQVLFFETKEQAEACLQESEVEGEKKS